MKYDGIVLFSDLDGTLLNDDRELAKENLDAVSYFVKEGGRFGIASGRMERTTLINYPDLQVNTPSIFFNGATIFDLQQEKYISTIRMPEGLESVFKSILNEFPTSCIEVNVEGKAYVFNLNDIIVKQLKREALEWKELPWDDVPKGWVKVLIADKHESLIKAKEYLDSLNRTDINYMFSEEELLDIMAKDVSKGATLSRLMEENRQKNNWRHVFAVGDNDNDLDMFKAADVGIAVGNARPALKAIAKHEILHNNIPCIPQVLKIIDSYL